MNLPMTVEDARIALAPLWKQQLEEKKAQNLAEGEPASVTRACHRIERFARACYSLPWLRKEMKAWMIDFCWGDENPFSKKNGSCGLSKDRAKELLTLLEEDKKDDFAEATGGALMKEVVEFLKYHGFEYTDTGGGGCGGHVGIPCTDDEMDSLIMTAHARFGKAIERGLLMVKVAWFKPRLFKNDEEAERWYHARGLI
jgi:hypothetical protein